MSQTDNKISYPNVIAVQNQQIYSFAGFTNSLGMIALACGFAIVIWHVPPSPRPEKAFLRLLARFFRHGQHLIARIAPDWKRKKDFEKLKTMTKLLLEGEKLPPKTKDHRLKGTLKDCRECHIEPDGL
jgi:hypothetical protein